MKTSRTHLRRFTNEDLDNMAQLESDPDIMKFTPSRIPQSRGQTKVRLDALVEKESLHGELGVWAAEMRETKEFVGWFMLLKRNSEIPELGFMIVQKFWGQGLTTEIAKVLVDYAFKTLGYKSLVAKTDPTNHASIRVLKKIGFQMKEKTEALNHYEIYA